MKTCSVVLLLAVASYAKPSNRIVGGEDALVHEFPYQVSLQLRNPVSGLSRHFCGGTILNNSYVLTAAHCKLKREDIQDIRVIAGAHNFSNKTGFEQTSSVEKFVNHPEYTEGVGPDDIAVIKLSMPFNFTDNVQAANLPESDLNATGMATLSGWGYISTDYTDVRPKVLQKAELEIFDDQQCRKLYTTVYEDTNLCAGHLPGVPNACKGDSGGPLAQTEDLNTYVIGVVSWGYYPCGARNRPTVFAEVAHYVDWIKEQMEE